MASLFSPPVSCQSAVTLETSLSIIPADPTARQQELPRAMTAGALCIRKTDTSTKRKLQAQRLEAKQRERAGLWRWATVPVYVRVVHHSKLQWECVLNSNSILEVELRWRIGCRIWICHYHVFVLAIEMSPCYFFFETLHNMNNVQNRT